MQSIQKLYSYAILHNLCTFSHASRILQLSLSHNDSLKLEIPAVFMATNPQKCQKLLFLRTYAPQTFCAHFAHASNDSHLNLPLTCNSCLGVSAVAMATTPQNCQKCSVCTVMPSQDWLYNYKN